MPTPIQVGIIGYGSSVKNYHLPYILSCPEMLHLRAILQRSAPPTDGASGHVAVDHPELTHYRTTDSFFADKEIELVIICTRVESHTELALAAINAGKHGMLIPRPSLPSRADSVAVVVVEKAFTPTAKEADKVIAAAKKAYQSERLCPSLGQR
jgi:predicted dehydrogenase